MLTCRPLGFACRPLGFACRPLGLLNRQRQTETSAAVGLERQMAAVGLGNLACHGQPQADALRLAGSKWLEQSIGHLRWRTGAAVVNTHQA